MQLQIDNAHIIPKQNDDMFSGPISLYLDSNHNTCHLDQPPTNWNAQIVLDADNGYVFSNIQDVVFLNSSVASYQRHLESIFKHGSYFIHNIDESINPNNNWTSIKQGQFIPKDRYVNNSYINIHQPINSAQLPLLNNMLNYARSINKSVYINANLFNPYASIANSADDSQTTIRLGLEQSFAYYETTSLFSVLCAIQHSQCYAYVYNISCHDSLEIIEWFKNKYNKIKYGVNIHHLLCHSNDIGYFNPLFKFNPPLRSSDNQKYLARGISNKLINFIYSGHTFLSSEQKSVTYMQAKAGSSSGLIFIPLLFKLAGLHRLNIADVLACANINQEILYGLDSSNIVIYHPHKINSLNAPSSFYNELNPFSQYPIMGKVTHFVIRQDIKSTDKKIADDSMYLVHEF